MPQGAGARNTVSNYGTSVIVEDNTMSEIDNIVPFVTPQVSSPPSGGLPVLAPAVLAPEDCGLNPGVSNTPNLSNTPTPSVTPSVQSEGSGGDINDNSQGIGEGEDSSPITAPPDVEIKIPHFISLCI